MWWLVDNWYWLNTAAETFHFWWVFFLHFYHISNPHWTLKMAHVFQHSEVNIKSLFLCCIMKITSRRACPFKSPPGQNGRQFGRRHFQVHFLEWKMKEIRFKFHWKDFPGVQSTINQNWFRYRLNQWWPSSVTHICSTWGKVGWVKEKIRRQALACIYRLNITRLLRRNPVRISVRQWWENTAQRWLAFTKGQ